MRERTLSVAALRSRVRGISDRLPGSADSRRGAAALATGVPALDEALGGGLPSGALTEIVSAGAGSGGQLVQLCLLRAAADLARRAVLIDAIDAFDPQTAGDEALRALIWVRCNDAATAMQAADLLVRDANLGLVLLDLRGCPQSALRRTPTTAWYRLQRAAEGTAAPVVVQTSQALVPSAACRVALSPARRTFGIESCGRPRDTLSAEVEVELLRARWSGGFGTLIRNHSAECSCRREEAEKPVNCQNLPRYLGSYGAFASSTASLQLRADRLDADEFEQAVG